jgi:aryl-alcohol dehydrogenase-like predicted oxidoreductase
MVEQKETPMEYQYLGNSGLKVSVFSFGNWLNSNKQDENMFTRDPIKLCFEGGINLIDTAELYGFGNAETLMGKAIKELQARRNRYFNKDLQDW